jgi:hypothetical protein
VLGFYYHTIPEIVVRLFERRYENMLSLTRWHLFLVAWCTLSGAAPGHAQEEDFTRAAQAFRQGKQPVQAISETTLLCEAEEFAVDGKGWQAKPFGANYYAATFANSFLSRKAYLEAPPQGETSLAHLDVQVPKAGKYLALVRYEAPFKFEAHFRLVIEQNGKKVLDRLPRSSWRRDRPS